MVPVMLEILLVDTVPLVFEPPKALVMVPVPSFTFVVVTPASLPPPKRYVDDPELKVIVDEVVSAFFPPPYIVPVFPLSTVTLVVRDVPPRLFPPYTSVADPLILTFVRFTVPLESDPPNIYVTCPFRVIVVDVVTSVLSPPP